MNRIGVLTFHNPINYGAVLQAYGLEKYIEKHGYESEIINYCNEKVTPPSNIFEVIKYKGIIGKIYKFLEYPFYCIRYKKFKKFLSNVNVSKLLLPNSFAQYDKIIVGSDQVWNLKITNNDFNFFLENQMGVKKYSFASSFGEYCFDDEMHKRVVKCLQEFECLNVRELSGKELIEKYVKVHAQCVLDPTFLLTSEEWQRVAKCKKRKRYVLIYQLAYSKTLIKVASKYASTNKLMLITINGNPRQPIHGKNIKTAGPEEWLGLIKNAEIIFTNSYHGTVFSIIFKKKFFTELLKVQSGRNDRVITLLDTLGLSDRILGKNSMDDDIVYDDVLVRLKEKVNNSREILNGILDYEE